MASLADLFAPDVRVGRDASGRPAIEAWFAQILRRPRASVHFVGNHVIDFDDAVHARGVVYCHDELEQPTTGEWQMGKLQCWDEYVRVDGEWCFARRRFHRWYVVDALERPSSGAGLEDAAAGRDPLAARSLPESFATWAPFWAQADA